MQILIWYSIIGLNMLLVVQIWGNHLVFGPLNLALIFLVLVI